MLATLLILTRNRAADLRETLDAIARLPLEGCELVVVDNASDPPASVPRRVGAMEARLVRLEANAGAAGRNAGAEAARGEWLVMLDDDSAPLDGGFLEMLAAAPEDALAIGGEILLPDGSHEVGGLPEVIVGCGAAVRREAFLDVGGYDAGFVFYAEEYDLCARLIARGGRIVHDGRLRVLHRKTAAGRDAGRIVRRLVRNEGVVAYRYAPEGELEAASARWLERRRRIAEREGVKGAFEAGRRDLASTLAGEERTPLSASRWDRFIGLSAAREAIAHARRVEPFETAAVVMPDGPPGKGSAEIERALAEAGVRRASASAAEAWVVGTLSPGAAADAVWRLGERASAEAGGKRVVACAGAFSSRDLVGPRAGFLSCG